MWKNILKWVLRFALAQLGADVDAETQKLLDAYHEKRAMLEIRRSDSEKNLKQLSDGWLALVARRTKLSGEIEFLQSQTKFLETKLEELKNEREKKVTDIRNLSDDDVLHLDLPSAG